MENYYKIKAVSNSSLSKINPEEGGHPILFKQFFEKGSEVTPSMERGTLLHSWIENRDKFVVSEIEKPSDNISKIIEYVHDLKVGSLVDNYILDGAVKVGYGNSWKPTTVIEKVKKEGEEYFKFLKESDGKVIMDRATNIVVSKCQIALLENKLSNKLLFFEDSFSNIDYLKEIEIFFEIGLNYKLACKGKLDRVDIDYDKKIIVINDLKTTSKPISLIENTILYWRYYRQGAFYVSAIFEYLDQKGFSKIGWTIEYNIVFVNTINFIVGVVKLSPEWLGKGYNEVVSLLKRIMWHEKNNYWEMSKEESENNGYIKIGNPDEKI